MLKEMIAFLIACTRGLSQLHRCPPTNFISLTLVVLVSAGVCTGCSSQQLPIEQLLACKFPGTWEGEAYHSSVGNFPVTIKLDEFKKGKICGSFEAPTFGCGGDLECVDIQAYGYPYTTGVYVVRNHEYGKCVAGFQHLVRENDNTLTGALFEYNEEFAYGTYHRTSSPIDPAECEPKGALRPFVKAGENDVNIHSGPGTNYPSIGTLPARKAREIIGRNADSSWWQISTDNGPGWIDASVVTAKNEDQIDDVIPVVEASPPPVEAVPTIPIACIPTPQSSSQGDLTIGKQAFVFNTGEDGLWCRPNPGTCEDPTGIPKLTDGTVVTIIGGPVTVSQDNYLWWQIEPSGQTPCWAAGNWLFPLTLTIPPPPVTETPSPSSFDLKFPWAEGQSGKFTQGPHPFNSSPQNPYSGIDFTLPSDNAPVLAAAGGKIRFAGWRDDKSGNVVIIDHLNGWATWYGHLSEVDVQSNDCVSPGKQVGIVGDTGRADFIHLHLDLGTWEQESFRPHGWDGSAVIIEGYSVEFNGPPACTGLKGSLCDGTLKKGNEEIDASGTVRIRSTKTTFTPEPTCPP